MISITALVAALIAEGAAFLLFLVIVLQSLNKQLHQLEARADLQLLSKWIDATNVERQQFLDRLQAKDLAEYRHLSPERQGPRVAKPMRNVWEDDRPHD